jgi:hypothetical protein
MEIRKTSLHTRSKEMTGRSQKLPWWLGGGWGKDDRKQKHGKITPPINENQGQD